MPHLDLDHLGHVLRLARDREGLGEPQRDDAGGQLHGANLRAPGARRRGRRQTAADDPADALWPRDPVEIPEVVSRPNRVGHHGVDALGADELAVERDLVRRRRLTVDERSSCGFPSGRRYLTTDLGARARPGGVTGQPCRGITDELVPRRPSFG